MSIPLKNTLGNPNVTEGNFQVAIEQLRDSVEGSGKAYSSSNTYSQYDTCIYNGVEYYSKVNSNTGNTPTIGANWGDVSDLILSVVHLTGNETISGTKTFSTSPIVPTPTTTGNIITMDNIIQKTAVGIGYGTGSGGTVTQLTSKSTAVTLNKPSGTITMNNATLASGASVTFILNNSIVGTVATTNVLVYIPVSSPNYASYEVKTYGGANGAYIVVKNISAGSLSDAVQINFELLLGATA